MYGTNITRVSGLASGMDTDSLVKKLMDAERIPVNQLKQKRQKTAWQSDAYRQWNSDVFSFRSTLTDMKLSKTYGTFSATSSNTNTVTATATAEAIPGSYKMKVNQLADAATLKGSVTAGATYKVTGGDQTVTVEVNGKKGTVTLKDNATMSDIVNAFKTAKADDGTGSLGIQAIYDSTLNQFIVKTKDTGQAQTLKLSSGNGNQVLNDLGLVRSTNTYTTDPATALTTQLVASAPANSEKVTVTLTGGSTPTKDITLQPGATVQDLMDQLKQSGIDVTFNSTDHTFNLSSKDPAVTAISLSSTSPDIETKLGLAAPAPATAVWATGTNAQVVFNGQTVSNLSTNNATFFGVNYTLNSVDATEQTLNVSRDLDAEVKNIKDFVTKYNDLLDKLNKAVSEPVYKDYQPLTDDQRQALSAQQIDQWETKAKSGLLRQDSTLTGLINSMRSSMVAAVDNGSKYNSLSAIGIKSTSYTDQGKLTVDETQLRKALQEDPDAVQNLFIQGGDITAGDIKADPTKQVKRGLIHRLSDNFADAFTQLSKKAGVTGNPQTDQSVIGKALQDMDTRITSMESRLTEHENRYYKQFAAMETAMNQYNSQGSWIAQQLGGGK